MKQSLKVGALLREPLESASPDLLREMVKTFADVLMAAEADAVCGAEYGERSPERSNSRNGYRARGWDDPAGTVPILYTLAPPSFCANSVVQSAVG
jgi:transposase-like protein